MRKLLFLRRILPLISPIPILFLWIWCFLPVCVYKYLLEEETALREIKEETGLSVALLPIFRTEDEHLIPWTHKEPVMKHIVYFLAEYENQSPKAQEEELSAIRLLPYEEAMAAFQFESSRRILTEAHRFLQQE